MSPVRDPVRALWAPEAAVEFSGPILKRAAAPETVDTSGGMGADVSAATAASVAPQAPLDKAGILEMRRKHVGPNLALFFQEDPLHIVRGEGCELFDAEGNAWLDCINNVSHVGHAHPKVAQAVAHQLLTLNTNSRYLHESLVKYGAALSATMPAPLECMYMTVSGSEANDLAWRIACASARMRQQQQQHAGSKDSAPPQRQHLPPLPLHVAVLDFAYHGHTSTCIDLSPYKFNGAGGSGQPLHVHVLPCPDVYRGLHLDGAAAARAAIEEAAAQGATLAAFFSESILSCGGQVVLPEGYLEGVYREMRAAGTVCVADEVQCGFGRVGSAFWGFELQGVVPDIVTFGKPCGNGFPMAGLVTSKSLAEAFSNGMEFFATFGGCTAAPTCGLAVLDVIREERLQENAACVGAYCMQQLRELQASHPDVIGEVRGEGLMIGVEIVTDPATQTHNPALARHIKQQCKQHHRVLLSSEGPFESVIKIKPPICFSKAQADRMVAAMSDVLGSVTAEDKAQLAERSQQEVEAVRQRHRLLNGWRA